MGQCNGRNFVVLPKSTAGEESSCQPGQVQQQVHANGQIDGLPHFLELKDRFGNPLFFNNAGDVLLAPSPIIPDPRQQLVDVRQMELREDDIIIAGYMKSGHHWVQQIVRMLKQDSVEYRPNTLSFEVLEYIPMHLMTKPSEARVFYTHLRFHHFPQQTVEKKVKVIHLLRNPKDTWVSLYCYFSQMKGPMGYRGTWDQFFYTMLEFGYYHGEWFDHVLDWEQEIASHPKHPVLVLYYEDLVQDPVRHVERLNGFLGLGRSEALCRSIVDTCTVAAMRAKEEVLVKQLDIYTSDSPGIYRKGEIGDWKNWFTPAQNVLFDKVFQKRMAHSKRIFKFE